MGIYNLKAIRLGKGDKNLTVHGDLEITESVSSITINLPFPANEIESISLEIVALN